MNRIFRLWYRRANREHVRWLIRQANLQRYATEITVMRNGLGQLTVQAPDHVLAKLRRATAS